MSDFQLMNFVEEKAIQIWPLRKSKYGPVVNWYAQNTAPFIQMHGTSVREALTKLHDAMEPK